MIKCLVLEIELNGTLTISYSIKYFQCKYDVVQVRNSIPLMLRTCRGASSLEGAGAVLV
uniref:Uncharacterized protein n=1 Tax=Rhizophora mucronata TaxID=61149 RepID=A0A2P2ISN5_RHIMU